MLIGSNMKIDNNYSIDSSKEGCTLICTETKTRENKKTKESEEYVVETPYYYSTVEQCLVKYLTLCQENAEDVEDCIALTRRVSEEIKQMLKKKK